MSPQASVACVCVFCSLRRGAWALGNLLKPSRRNTAKKRPRDDYFDKPFFEFGKAIGDKRAIVAEKGFNRPFKRVLIGIAGAL